MAEIKMTELHGAVRTADDWTRLFERYDIRENNWIGADGIFSYALDGNDAFASADENTKNFFIFSDTTFGTSNEDGKEAVWYAMPNHTSALFDGCEPDISKRRFVWGRGGSCSLRKEDLDDESEKNLVGKRKWFTDGLVLGDRLYLFCYTPIGLGNNSVDMAEFPIVDGTLDYANFKLTEPIPQLYMLDEDGKLVIDYGYAVHVNTKEAGAPDPDGYIYIYGGGPHCRGYVSRIKADVFPDFSQLRYWDGKGWSENIADSAVILPGISREYSVSPITKGSKSGKYIAVFMDNCISGDIVYSIADTPYGPFETKVKVYHVPEAGEKVLDAKGKDDTVFTYNSKAHPHLSKGSSLLISYNTNLWNGWNTPYSYHPRFIWLDLEMI